MRTEFIIVVALAIGATFFVVAMAVGLLINKVVEGRRSKKKVQLYDFYSGLFADILLQPAPEGASEAALPMYYESLLGQIKSGLAWSTPARKRLHRGSRPYGPPARWYPERYFHAHQDPVLGARAV